MRIAFDSFTNHLAIFPSFGPRTLHSLVCMMAQAHKVRCTSFYIAEAHVLGEIQGLSSCLLSGSHQKGPSDETRGPSEDLNVCP